MTAKASKSLVPAKPLLTLGDWLNQTLDWYKTHNVAVGQISTNPHDEALYLILRTLDLPLDSKRTILRTKLSATQGRKLSDVLHHRIIQRTPAAYLTKEAFLGEHRFYVDERTIIPRSYFLEIIPEQLDAWLPKDITIKQVVDVCTGSGCLAILLAHHFPEAKVDAIDLSPAALEVAKINVRDHGLSRRLTLHHSDVFDSVAPKKYDVILSNPPYEPSAHVDAMAAEFHREPRMSLDGGSDGLDIIRKLLHQARERLQPHGIVLIEVGGLQDAMDEEFAELEPHWLTTHDGSNCICVIHASRLIGLSSQRKKTPAKRKK